MIKPTRSCIYSPMEERGRVPNVNGFLRKKINIFVVVLYIMTYLTVNWSIEFMT